MTDEYISREAARRMVNQLPRYTWSSPVSTDYCVAASKDAVLFGLDRIPAADVAPVVHGQWIYGDDGVYTCCKCGNAESNDSFYCRYCGARMDGAAE